MAQYLYDNFLYVTAETTVIYFCRGDFATKISNKIKLVCRV